MLLSKPFQNLLVTGGAGFIGSAFIRYLLHRKNFTGSIVNLDLLTYAAHSRSLESIENKPNYHLVQGNICNKELVCSLIKKYKIDLIVHFAAETHVDRSISDPDLFLETNIRGTFSLLEVIRNFSNIHFHHVSTDEVYGSLGESGKFSENSPYRPNSPYAATKAASDHLVRSYANTYGISATISHCSNNYGPFQNEEKFIPLMIQRCLRKESLPIYGRGVNVRDWIYVEDHADALWCLLNNGYNRGTYNISGNSELKNLDLLALLIEILSNELKEDSKIYYSLIRFVTDRPGHDFRYAIDDQKFRDEFQWQPKYQLREGLRKTIKWHLDYFSHL